MQVVAVWLKSGNEPLLYEPSFKNFGKLKVIQKFLQVRFLNARKIVLKNQKFLETLSLKMGRLKLDAYTRVTLLYYFAQFELRTITRFLCSSLLTAKVTRKLRNINM